MKWYSVTAWDEAATVPINVTVCGDITITVSHARQAMGSLKICQIHFLPPPRSAILQLARYSDTFR